MPVKTVVKPRTEQQHTPPKPYCQLEEGLKLPPVALAPIHKEQLPTARKPFRTKAREACGESRLRSCGQASGLHLHPAPKSPKPNPQSLHLNPKPYKPQHLHKPCLAQRPWFARRGLGNKGVSRLQQHGDLSVLSHTGMMRGRSPE